MRTCIVDGESSHLSHQVKALWSHICAVTFSKQTHKFQFVKLYWNENDKMKTISLKKYMVNVRLVYEATCHFSEDNNHAR